ncbi:MAG: thioredoxin family protein [Candidatus Tectomicrobia bacterium]|uniref:Thioredoxin family protein n=1 Tax=Tectimicrobiota bacterium TaxID=2528274 RepID=A0A932FWF5_UNCTE|nr:thioredoxin family protein [Candidatus Tectomicrobia bacterium]
MGRKMMAVLALVSMMVWVPFIGVEAAGVELLFAYSSGCSHCAYQKPIVRKFQERHPEVGVRWVNYSDLNRGDRKLIEGTSGHPVMVFHNGGHVRQMVGETSLSSLEEEYLAFKKQPGGTGASKITTGSNDTCDD